MKNRISNVSAEIAAKLSYRQVETLYQLERTSRGIDKAFQKAVGELLAVVANDDIQGGKIRAYSEAMQSAVMQAKDGVRRSFERLVIESHRSASDAIASSVPDPVLIHLIPVEDRYERIEKPRNGRLIMGYGGLEIVYEDAVASTFGVPDTSLRKRELTDEEKLDIAKKILFPPPSQREVAEILARGVRDASGAVTSWSERFDSLSGLISDKKLAFSEIAYWYSQGESISGLKKRIKPLVDGVSASAQRVARTEGMRIAERMQRRSWDELGDMMVGVQVIAVLDERTRPEHATRNGIIYYKNPKPGQKSMADLPDLPDAPNCRCMTSPVLSMPDELKNDPEVRDSFRLDRLPGTTDAKTYDKWFAKADASKRKQVTGVARYNAVKEIAGSRRQPDWIDFIDEDGQLLTISQLQNETAVERQARKQRIRELVKKRGTALRSVSSRGFEF